MRREGCEVMRREGREVMKREGREVVRREGQGHVTACDGSTGTLALVRQLHRGGWTALSGVW
jgi:hypothetical protein